MKRIIVLATMLALACALTACATGKSTEASSQASSQSSSQASAETEASSASVGSSASADSSTSVGLANPWTEAKTAEDAAQGAGVGYFQVPEDGTIVNNGPINWYKFQYMEMLAEADGAVGPAELTVRKGVKKTDKEVNYDKSDVSGDYTDYKYQWDMKVGDWQVKCYGNEDGKTMKAIWSSDNFSYAIMVRGQGEFYDTFGLGAEDVATLVEAIQ